MPAERFVRLRGRARGPSGVEGDEPTVWRVDEGRPLPGGVVRVRAWVPPWDGDSWPEFHQAGDLEQAPIEPRSADDVDLLPRGELVALLERCTQLPKLPEILSGSDLDLMVEVPARWGSRERVTSTEWVAVAKILKLLAPLFEEEKLRFPLGEVATAPTSDPVIRLAELRHAQAEAYQARHDWVAEVRLAAVVGRRPSAVARRARALVRKRARLAERAYVAALNAEA